MLVATIRSIPVVRKPNHRPGLKPRTRTTDTTMLTSPQENRMVSTMKTEAGEFWFPKWLRMTAAASTTHRPTTVIRSALARMAAWLSLTTAE